MNKSETIGKLAEALAKAQGMMEGAKKDSTNPFFKSKYSDLASVWEACRKPLSENGLSVSQIVNTADDGSPIIVTLLMHTSGEWLSGELVMHITKIDPQTIGSATTYGRRYALAAIVGIAPEDDDAETAQAREHQSEPSRKSQLPPINPLLATGAQLNTIKALFLKLGIEPDTAFLQAALKLETKPKYFQDVTKEVAAEFIKHLQELDVEVK